MNRGRPRLQRRAAEGVEQGDLLLDVLRQHPGRVQLRIHMGGVPEDAGGVVPLALTGSTPVDDGRVLEGVTKPAYVESYERPSVNTWSGSSPG